MNTSNVVRYGLVTFLLGITTGIMGAYLPESVTCVIIPILSALYAGVAGIAVAGGE